MWTVEMMQWTALVALGAGLLLVHASLVVRTVRMPGLTPLERIITLAIPPVTPIFAFSLGAKRRAGLWWVLALSYALVWFTV